MLVCLYNRIPESSVAIQIIFINALVLILIIGSCAWTRATCTKCNLCFVVQNLFLSLSSKPDGSRGTCRHWEFRAAEGSGYGRWVPVDLLLYCSLSSTSVHSDLILYEQRMEKCSWCAKWVDTTRASCTPWRCWRKPPLCRKPRRLSTRAQRGRCWSTSDSLHFLLPCTMPSRQTPSFTSF